jgi:hypothetical protein
MATITVTKGYNHPTGFTSGQTVTPAILNSAQTPSVTIADIATTDISNSAITADKLAASATTDASRAVTTNHIRDLAVTTAKLAANSVTSTILRDSAALSVIGNPTNSTTNPADIAASTDGHVLRRSGTALGFGTLGLSSLALPSNFPIQVVQAVKTNAQTINTGASDWVDVTSLSITLTRRIASSSGAVRIQANISCSSNNSNSGIAFRIVRGSTAIGVGTSVGGRLEATVVGGYSGTHTIPSVCLDFIDNSPGSSSTVSYKIQARIYSASEGYINFSNSDTDAGDYSYRTISTMTVTELAP